MCDRSAVSLNTRHSWSETQSPKSSEYTRSSCKSDVNIILSNRFPSTGSHSNNEGITTSENSGCGEYYKRYDHDETPVKDYSDIASFASGKGDRLPLTESHLVKLEKTIYSDISQEPPTSSSSKSLDSNVKFFKTTVEQIFDKFYNNMQDYDRYKKRYQDILIRNRDDSLEEMEDFIKDMIHHIMSSESSVFNESCLCKVMDKATTAVLPQTSRNVSLLRNLHNVVEAFKNDNYFTDSTLDDKGCLSNDLNNKINTDEILSIHVSPGNPFVKIKMNNRKLFSEININNSRVAYEPNTQAASAEDIQKVMEKKVQLETHERQQEDTYTPHHIPDRDIPVKLSFAKRNIHLNEDFESNQSEKSFISRLCNYLCKRLRRTSMV